MRFENTSKVTWDPPEEKESGLREVAGWGRENLSFLVFIPFSKKEEKKVGKSLKTKPEEEEGVEPKACFTQN